jgi:hypothetical protein
MVKATIGSVGLILNAAGSAGAVGLFEDALKRVSRFLEAVERL